MARYWLSYIIHPDLVFLMIFPNDQDKTWIITELCAANVFTYGAKEIRKRKLDVSYFLPQKL